MKSVSILLPCMVALLFLTVGCKPDRVELEVYTSDLKKAMAGEVLNVPMIVTFSIMGSDDDGYLPRLVDIAKQYFDSDAEFTITKAEFGDAMVIKSTIPIGTAEALKTYLGNQQRPVAMVVNQALVKFEPTDHLQRLRQEVRGVNYMFDIEASAKSTVLRIIGDMEEIAELVALAVFIDKKPELIFRKSIGRRESVAITYRGDDGSIYSEIAPQFTFELK